MYRLVLLLGLYAGVVCAQDSLNIRSVGRLYSYWSNPEDFVISRYTAYVAANEAGLFVLDLREETAPRIIGHYDTRQANSVLVEGTTAYVSDADELLIFDVSRPDDMWVLGSVATAGPAVNMVKWRNILYLAQGEAGFSTYDVANPAAPRRLSVWPGSDSVRTNVTCLRTHSTDLFVGEAGSNDLTVSRGLRVFDMSDPARPQQIGRLNEGAPCSMELRNDLLLIADYSSSGWPRGRFRVVDVARPETPEPLGSLLVSFTAPPHTAMIGDRVYISTGNMLWVMNYSNPSAPVIEGFMNGTLGRIRINGNRMYGMPWGLSIWNINEPARPECVGTMNNQAGLYQVELLDTLACITDAARGLHLVSVRDAARPVEFAVCSLLTPGTCLAVYGHMVYQSAGPSFYPTISVTDLTNPHQPVNLGSIMFSAQDNLKSMRIHDEHMYLLGDSTVTIVSLEIPSAARFVARIGGLCHTANLCFADNSLFVADSSGLRIWDVSFPARPMALGGYTLPAGDIGSETYVIRERAYFEYWHQTTPGNWTGSMMVLDVSDPNAVTATDIVAPYIGNNLTANEHFLIGTGKSMLTILDTRYADSLRVSGYYRTPGTANSFSMRNSLIYLADMSYFDILDIQQALLPAAEIPARLMPEQAELADAYPNPFNPATTLTFSVPKAAHVTLKVYDLVGREAATLADEQYPAGTYRVTFDGSRFASGVYFARLSAGGSTDTQKLVLLK